jgi:hypothetical protein
MEHEGLTYPTEITLEKTIYVRTGEQGREEITMLRYRDYRFFKVGTEEEEARETPIGGADGGELPPEGSPPPPPPPSGPGP